MNLVLLGPPGAGKGSQAEVLSQRLNIPHVSTGDILRQNVKDDTSIGRRAREYMQKGELVPDEIVIKMVEEFIGSQFLKNGFILDGFPRTLEQAERLDRLLTKLNKKLDLVMDFKTTNPVIIERLSGRRICENCAANYHIKNIPPKVEGICDKCGGKLYQRSDDKPETVLRRINLYYKDAAPLIEYYREKGILESVCGDLGIEALYKVIIDTFLKNLLYDPN